ncbi:MAG: carboxylating nicotinate-nucleotide diphosphorylase [Ignavibacteria bacterium]|nr:carboxylating nicotinate-nucleotide diphosphorylase [Ignavibacteria bacterium]
MPFLPYQQLTELEPKYITKQLLFYLEEDTPQGDITSDAIFTDEHCSTAYIENEEEIVFAGQEILQLLESISSSSVKVEIFCKDGDSIPSFSKIAKIFGQTKFILKIERTLLNLLQRLCGIATQTNKFVKIAEPYGVKILDTRKTTPGLRIFEKYAVRCGGGFNHRLDLSSGILIKDNHIKAAGTLENAVLFVKTKYPDKFIEVEVENFKDLQTAVTLGVDGVLLDNFSPKEVAQFVEFLRTERPEIFIEASGGINIGNIEEYAKTKVDAISVGALTHSVRASKLHIEFE